MIYLAVICAFVAVLYIAHLVKPTHVRFRAMFGRFASIDFEARNGKSAEGDGGSAGAAAEVPVALSGAPNQEADGVRSTA
jgi:hypothetical protein